MGIVFKLRVTPDFITRLRQGAIPCANALRQLNST